MKNEINISGSDWFLNTWIDAGASGDVWWRLCAPDSFTAYQIPTWDMLEYP